MSTIDRYRAHLQRQGVASDVRVVEEAALALGAFHFYRVDVRGQDEHRAAVSPAGLVGARHQPDDAWWQLLAAGDADAIADRVAWLESTPDLDRHARGHRVVVVRGGHPPAGMVLDPLPWKAAPAPRLDVAADHRTLVVWLYTTGADEPVERTVRALPDGPAQIVERPAHEVIDLGRPTERAAAALSGDDRTAIAWGLRVLADAGATSAVPAIVPLLGRDDSNLRSAAADALGALRADDAIDALATAAAHDADRTAQVSEIQALGKIGSPAAARALGALRAHVADKVARAEILHALARIGTAATPEVRAAFADAAAHDPDADLRALAASYAKRLTP